MCMEAPLACAEHAAKWIDEEMEKWGQWEDATKKNWTSLTSEQKEEKTNEWINALKAKI